MFDDIAPLLDHKHRFEAIGEGARSLPVERPDKADLIDPDAKSGSLHLADFQVP